MGERAASTKAVKWSVEKCMTDLLNELRTISEKVVSMDESLLK